jgi:hypothetical protein
MTPPPLFVAQTNLQLYSQMVQSHFDEPCLALVNDAYLLAARGTGGLLRGSGKPFVCHLVGAASLVAHAGQDGSCIAATLLHATYQNRVDAGTPLQQRDTIRRRFGSKVESLVSGYHEFASVPLREIDDGCLRRMREVAIMRLADEIEDLLDHGIAMHGAPGDGEQVVGSAAFRRAAKIRAEPELRRIAAALNASALEGLLAYWLAQTIRMPWPSALRTGEYSSFRVPSSVDSPG